MSSKTFATVLTAALGLTVLAACATDSGGDTTADGKTVVKVALEPGQDKSAVDAFNARVAQFEQANPGIDLVVEEFKWDPTKFTAQLAGGTLPDVVTVPFTDGRGLIERHQIADISGDVTQLPYAGKFNPEVAKTGQDASGKQQAIPIAAYTQALHYNRTLFKQAGLDPDRPPSTWDEVRADAKQIAERTGAAGYAQMTKDNTGGWILVTQDYAFGGRTEKLDGDKATATIDTPQLRQVLQNLRAMRWDDNSMGANFLYDWNGINQDFAAGRIGMYVSGGGNYKDLLSQNAIKPADYGVTALPLTGPDAGALGGGTLAVVNVKASKKTQSAAVKWIDFYYLRKLTDEAAAQGDAKTNADAKQAVGSPELPVFDKATYDERLRWIGQYVNVPLPQMTPYTSKMFDQQLLPEPTRATQKVYGVLDTVVQKVLTDRGADVNALLADAQTQAQALLDRS
ncbi:ABC transporter substrate-binding protein [Amycolatopsis sp. CA-126428]|uniref:ABC transporter substrate-binding protein n=1 Tax=Amycolatopsis sp. CA-126428 TaxID=2073158 RepID=UPI000CD2B1DB|nr:extracellular solute-binding protein [Amycolatopsis sp. CA-126428]